MPSYTIITKERCTGIYSVQADSEEEAKKLLLDSEDDWPHKQLEIVSVKEEGDD